MRNIIKFKITGNYNITHNGQPFTNEEVVCKHGKNKIIITGEFTLLELTMFNLGADELYKIGKYKKNSWILNYEYPVFSWLHKTLDHGWLIKKDNL